MSKSGSHRKAANNPENKQRSEAGAERPLDQATLQIEYVAPALLNQNKRNAQKHSPENVDQIAASIDEFGFNAPILIDANNQIVAGHGRYLAAQKLGFSEVPVVRIEHLTSGQLRAYAITDNRLSELSSWDFEILALELEELSVLEDAPEITVTGFSMALTDAIIDEHRHPKAEEDPADVPISPQAIERVARLGDLWLCGRHRLFVGSALEREGYKVLLDGRLAQQVVIDPPFNCRVAGHVSGNGKVRHREFVMASGEMTDAQYTEFLGTAFERLIEASVDGSIHHVFSDWRALKTLLTAGEVYSELKNLAVWVKSGGGGMGSLYRSRHELVAVFKSGSARHINNVELGKNGRSRSNVWEAPGMNTFQKGRAEKLAMHPTVKPVGLIADALLDCSTRGGLVLDVFAGSGTILLAAERTGRTAAAMELDPLYVDVALRRFCDVTGIEPVNAATGQIVRRREPKGDRA